MRAHPQPPAPSPVKKRALDERFSSEASLIYRVIPDPFRPTQACCRYSRENRARANQRRASVSVSRMWTGIH